MRLVVQGLCSPIQAQVAGLPTQAPTHQHLPSGSRCITHLRRKAQASSAAGNVSATPHDGSSVDKAISGPAHQTIPRRRARRSMSTNLTTVNSTVLEAAPAPQPPAQAAPQQEGEPQQQADASQQQSALPAPSPPPMPAIRRRRTSRPSSVAQQPAAAISPQHTQLSGQPESQAATPSTSHSSPPSIPDDVTTQGVGSTVHASPDSPAEPSSRARPGRGRRAGATPVSSPASSTDSSPLNPADSSLQTDNARHTEPTASSVSSTAESPVVVSADDTLSAQQGVNLAADGLTSDAPTKKTYKRTKKATSSPGSSDKPPSDDAPGVVAADAPMTPAPVAEPLNRSASPAAQVHTADAPVAPRRSSTPVVDKQWVPSGPDALVQPPEAVKDTAVQPKAASKAETSWIRSWGAAPAGKGPAAGSRAAKGAGLLIGRKSTDGAANSLASRVERNKAMMQSWGGADGGAAGPAGAAGGALSRTGTSSALAITGPSMVPHPTHGWLLQGCDAELAQLPSRVALLQSRLSDAISAEKEAERDALAALYSQSNLAKLQRDGVVLAGLRATLDGELYRNVTWRFELGPARGASNNSSPAGRPGGQQQGSSAFLPYHRFRQGESVLISRFAPGSEMSSRAAVPVLKAKSFQAKTAAADDEEEEDGDEPTMWCVEGTVLEVKRTHLLVALERKDSDRLELQRALMTQSSPGGALWRVDASVKDVTAARQRQALARLGQWLESGRSITLPAPPPAGEALVRLALTCTDRTTSILAEQPPVWVRDPAWREGARRLLAAQTNLNDSQRKAVSHAMVRSLTLWQGPPGTGKTRTLLALINVLVGTSYSNPRSWATMGPLLACGDTNAAVDNLVEGLQALGMKVVRVGNPAKVRPSLRHVTVEALAERDTTAGRESARIRVQAQKKLDAAREARESADERTPVGLLERWAATEASARMELSRADTLLKTGMEEVIQGAQVVCATCTGAGDHMIASHTFKVVVIDEASQATEPATLVPLTKGVHCVIMAGDPRQLPPTVTSRKALDYKLDVTLFERLSSNGLQPLLLDTQYRMHPVLSEFASARFYGARLKDGVSAADKPCPAGIPWPVAGLPLAFLQVAGEEARASVVGSAWAEGGGTGSQPAAGGKVAAGGSAGGASYRNAAEAEAAMRVLDMLAAAGDVSSVALLTPYKGQVRTLEALLRQPPPRVAQLMATGRLEVTVSSVDGFQGREADAVIFSAVRSNQKGNIGFVADARRLNVGITRPRRGLVVLGNDATLAAGSDDWREYISWLSSKGVVLPAERVLGQQWQHGMGGEQQMRRAGRARSRAVSS